MGSILASSATRLAWLEEWLTNGPPVCVISGFSGVGKTMLARDLVDANKVPSVYIPLDGSGYGLDDVLFSMAGELENQGLPTMAVDSNNDLLASLALTSLEPQLIVMDDFDHLLDPRTGLPPIRFIRFIERLGTGPSTKIRLLIVMGRALPENVWEMPQVVTLTVTAPVEDEAKLFLDHLLQREGLEDELSQSERVAVVNWLGRNLGAIESLVVCLREDSIDQLVQLDQESQESWDMRDQVASPKLVKTLERRFLHRTLSRLDADGKLLAELLSVHRRQYTEEAIIRAGRDLTDWKAAKSELRSRYLLERRKNLYSLHPVVRQLCLETLKDSRRRSLRAHNLAADYYARHFQNVNNLDTLTKHGTSFVEAKYHLIRADRTRDFENLAGASRRLLLRVYGNTARIPSDKDQKLELLALLQGALSNDDKGFAKLRGLLAKLLLDRNAEGDDRVALRQLELASAQSRDPEIWRLRVWLTTRFSTARIAESVARQGFAVLAETNHGYLYAVVAHAYNDQGHLPEGLRFLDEGLTKLSMSSRIYLSPALGQLLSKAGRASEAVTRLIDLYRSGAPTANYYWRPLEQAMFIAHSSRDVQALRRIAQTLVDTNEKEAYRALCDMLILQQLDQYRQAAQRGSDKYPELPALAAQVAFCWLCCPDVTRALSVVTSTSLPNNLASTWLQALAYYCAGRIELAVEMLERLEDRNLDSLVEGEIAAMLVSIWDHIPTHTNKYPAFYFPMLPSSLTGLDVDLHKGSEYSALGGFSLTDLQFPKEVPFQPASNIDVPASQIVNIYAEHIGDKVMSEYKVNQAAAVGDYASASGVTFNQFFNQNSNELVSQLRRVHHRMADIASSDDESQSALELEAAANALEAGTPEEAKSRLAKAGDWALGVATTIGASLVVEAIKVACGMP